MGASLPDHPVRGPLRNFLEDLATEAEDRREGLLQREPTPLAGIDFASNDYLGLSRHTRIGEAMRRALEYDPFGCPASRLLGGHTAAHAEVEDRLAAFKGTEAALLFSSGYAANIGTLGALIRKEDRALSDELNHASLIDGLRLAGCRREIYPHIDLDALEFILRRPHPGGRTFIVTETLFSMDGDLAPIERIAALADRHGALLILDEAHATGLWGEKHRSGLAERFGVADRAAAIVSTCGKALGLWGAFVAGPREVIDCVMNRARPFIFSTAVPPVLLAGIGAALEVLRDEPERVLQLHANSARLRAGLGGLGISPGAAAASEGPIVPVTLGSNERALEVAAAVRGRGFDVRAIRPPSVPEGTARIRISVHAQQTEAEIDGLSRALTDIVERTAPMTAGGRAHGLRGNG